MNGQALTNTLDQPDRRLPTEWHLIHRNGSGDSTLAQATLSGEPGLS
jgi:ABC-type molybdenum transport system ATPase subunit/photorepair protein PhrA